MSIAAKRRIRPWTIVAALLFLLLATEIVSRLTIGSATWGLLTIRTVRSEDCRDSFDELVKYLRAELTHNRRPISEPSLPGDVDLVRAEYGIHQTLQEGVCTFVIRPVEPGVVILGGDHLGGGPMKLSFQGRNLLGSVRSVEGNMLIFR